MSPHGAPASHRTQCASVELAGIGPARGGALALSTPAARSSADTVSSQRPSLANTLWSRQACAVNQPGRTVHAYVSHGDRWLGALPPFPVESPWWPDVEPVNRVLTERLGVATSVLRLVSATGTAPRGGAVTYHVEVARDVTRPQPWLPISTETRATVLAPQPLRRSWAKPGGPAADLRWADRVLATAGRTRTGQAEQVKTWNLSCVHRLPTSDGNLWLKVTGAEQTREELPIAEVARYDPSLVATVVGTDPAHGRILTTELPGRDLPEASLGLTVMAIDRWVSVQAAIALAGVEMLARKGIRAWPVSRLEGEIERLLGDARTGSLSADERSRLVALVRALAARIDQIDAAGVPDSLVHGDFTSINWRGGESGVAVMDWSDAYLGHPAADLIALLGRAPESMHQSAIDAWCRAWSSRLGSFGASRDLHSAVSLVRPLVHLRMALVYARFLDSIEPSERCYHEEDPVIQLRLALQNWDA